MAGQINLPPLETKMVVNIDEFKNDMEKAKHYATTKAEEISKNMTKVSDVGKTLSKVGDKATKSVSLPLIAAATASTRMAQDYSKAVGNIKTLIDGTGEEMERRASEVSGYVKQMSKDINMDLADLADGAYNVISAFGDTDQVEGQLEAVAKAAKAGGASASEALDLLSAVTKGYGDTSAEAMQKASDLAFITLKLGQTSFPELAGSIGRVIPMSNALGVSQEELFGIMATATGVTGGAAEVSTQLRGVLQALMSPTEDMATLMEELGYESGEAMIKGEGFHDTLMAIVNAAKEAGVPLQRYISSIEGQNIALALSGDLQDTWIEKTAAMGDVAGATEEAFKKVYDMDGERVSRALNKIKVNLVEAGEHILPLVVSLTESIAKLAEKFGNMDAATQKTIIKLGGLAIAFGPVMKGIGGLLQLAPKLTGVFTTIGVSSKLGTEALKETAKGTGLVTKALEKTGLKAGLASTKFGSLISKLGAMAAVHPIATASVVGLGVALGVVGKKLSEEVVPEVDLFADSVERATDNVVVGNNIMADSTEATAVRISDATKKAVGAYMELDESLTKELFNINASYDAITTESLKSMTSKVDQMGKMIIDKEKETYNSRLALMTEYFETSSTFNATEQQKILDNLNKHHDEAISKTQEHQEAIKQILQKAADENRALKQSERDEIQRIQTQMKIDAVNTLSETEEEAIVIRQRLKDRQIQITTEEASEMLKKAIETKNEEIRIAEEKYDELIKEAHRLKEAGIITEQQYNKMIQDAGRARDEQVKSANDGLEQIKQAIEKSSPGILSNIDMLTGEIKTKWQSLWDSLRGIWSDMAAGAAEMRNTGGWTAGYTKGWTPTTRNVSSSARYTGGRQGAVTRARGGVFPTSHYGGLDFVPYDGYIAKLHRGERILTAQENAQANSPIIINNSMEGRKLDDMIVLLRTIADKELRVDIDGKRASRTLAPHLNNDLAVEVIR